MPISSKKLVYDFRRKFNSINSGKNRDISLVDVVAYLNEAQEIWYENRVSLADINSKVRNDLRVFKETKVELECEDVDDKCCFSKYPDNFYKRLNQVALSCNDCCPDFDKEIIIRINQSDDINESRKNPFRQADFFFEQLNGVDGGSGVYIYHDSKMEIKNIFIDYYRKPNEIHAPSLEKCNNGVYYDYCGIVINKDSDFEVDATYAANDVVDIAVLLASRDNGDFQSFQSQLAQILQTENIFKNNN